MKKYLSALIAGLAFAATTRAAVVLNEEFNYEDGTLTNVAGGRWVLHSSSGAHIGPLVTGGRALVAQTNTPDVGAVLAGAPYTTGNLYASFIVNFSALPLSGAGNYFAHFKDDGTINFRCRVFATVSGAASGTVRVGIANGSGTAVIIPRDLALETDFLLVVRYNAGTGASTLWINPGSEAATADRADGTDTVTAVGITTFALRQSNAGGGMGVLTLDNLKVGTAFVDVVSPTLRISASGDDVQIYWSSSFANYVLQATDELVPSNWLDVNDPIQVQGDKNVVTYNNATGHRFYRLNKP